MQCFYLTKVLLFFFHYRLRKTFACMEWRRWRAAIRRISIAIFPLCKCMLLALMNLL